MPNTNTHQFPNYHVHFVFRTPKVMFSNPSVPYTIHHVYYSHKSPHISHNMLSTKLYALIPSYDALIFGGPVDNPSTRRIYVLGRFAPKSWYLTSTNYPWTPSYSAPLPYAPSPGPIHSCLNLKYEKKMNNYNP